MKEQRWIRWEPIPQLVNNYGVDQIYLSTKGLKIVLYEMKQEYKTVEILFKNSIVAYTRTDESFSSELEGTFEDDPEPTEDPRWTFFKISNSSYIKKIVQEKQNLLESSRLIHFALLADDDLVDIIAESEPEVTVKNWNIRTFMLLYKERIMPIIDRYLPNTKIILYGPRARAEVLVERLGATPIQIALDTGHMIDPKVIGQIKDALKREAAVKVPKSVIDFHTAHEELQQQILQEGIDWKKAKDR